jgi:hypothetical protein
VLEVHVFPPCPGRFVLYEDDGETTAYQQGRACLTAFEMRADSFCIEPGQGEVSGVPALRTYRLIFRRIAAPEVIHLEINGVARDVQMEYAESAQDLTIELTGIAPADRVELTLHPIATAQIDRRAARCREMLRRFRMESDSKRWIDQSLEDLFEDAERLREFGPAVKASHIAALRSLIESQMG